MRVGAPCHIRRILTDLCAVFALLSQSDPAAANDTQGAWSSVAPWPMVAVHVVLMPDGRVLSYGTQAVPITTCGILPRDWGRSPDVAKQCRRQHLLQFAIGAPGGNGVFIAGGGGRQKPKKESACLTTENDTLTR